MKKYSAHLLLIPFLMFAGIAVHAAPIGGSVVVKATSASTDSVCAGTNSKILELTGYFGTIVRWEYSFSGNNPWTTIAHTTDEYTLTNLSTSMYVRAILLDGTTAASSPVFIRVDQPTQSGKLVGNNTVCSGTNSGSHELTGYVGRINSWIFSSNLGSTWIANASKTRDTLNYNNLNNTTWYRVEVKNGACAFDTSNIVKVNVSGQTVAGSVLIGGLASKNVCSGDNSGTLNLTTHTGNVIAWERAPSSNGPWTQLFNNTVSQTFTNLTSTTYYRAIVSSAPCDTLFSAAASIVIDQTSDAGTLSGDVVTCVGTNTGTLTTSNFTGSPTNWLSSADNATWTLINNASPSYTYNNIADTTWYKAIVTNGTCPADTSSAIKVNANPTTVGGSINSPTQCYQINTGTLTLTGHTGEIIRWENASNSGGPWSTVTNSTASLDYQNVINTTYYRAVIKSPGCLQQYSSTSTLTIDPTSVAGTISGNTSACASGNSFTLSTTGVSGAATNWLSSNNSGSNWTSLSITTDTLGITNQAVETWYRFVSKSGVCPTDTSSIFKVKSDPTSVGGTMAASAATVCSGNNGNTITLSGNTGSVVRWETAVNANGPWSGVNHTSNSLTYSNLTNTVFYRAIVKSGLCAETPSDSAKITVEPGLVGGRIVGSGVGCEGENSGLFVLNNYGGTITKWQWSDDLSGTWSDSVTTSPNFAYSNLLKTTWYRVQVQAGVCGSTFSDTAMIQIYSEPVVNFTTPRTCMDKSVSFANQTINGNNNQYTWAFGDGNSSNLQNPKYNYSAHGSFAVTLTARTSDNCSASLTQNITIDSIPNVVFTKSNVCKGQSISFTNTSTPIGGTSSWSFGDGGTSSSKDTIYTYTTEGAYTSSLTYTAPNGCSITETKTVEIYPQPVSAFTHPSVSENSAFQFVNSSYVSSGTIGFQWDFGNGSSSFVQNPTHTYSDTGNYSVRLISLNQNCRDTLTKIVVANPRPVVNFTASALCQNDSTEFTNQSTIKKGGVTYAWDFDDGSSSTIMSPKHKFATSGNYKVELTVTSDSGFSTSFVKNVTIDPIPVVNFSTIQACEGDTTQFKNISTINGGTASYIWDFGVPSSGAATKDAQYRYTTGGNYSVKLIATSNKGCIDSVTNAVGVYFRPVVKWGADTVCAGSATQFTDSTTVQGGRSNNFDWDFGNSNGTSVRNPSYQYANYGTYLGKLKVTSDKGCIDSLIKNVVVNALPVPNFVANDACQRDSITFNNTSFHPLAAGMTYSWDFGVAGANSTSTSPKYAYSNAGQFNAKLVATATATQCKDSVIKLITSHPRAIPGYSAAGTCNGSNTQFVNSSLVSNGSLTYFWEFGDLNNSSLPNPSHKYANAGNYNSKLTVTTLQGCRDSAVQIVYVWPQPSAKFATQNVCNGDSLVLINQSTYSSGSAIPDSTISYIWDFGDGDTAHAKNIKHLYNASGIYKVTLEGTTDSGCVSSLQKTIEVYALPKADFEFLNACEYDSLSFTNKSSSVYGSVNPTWYFGDNSNSNLIDPNHQYASWGSYKVKLEVTDKFACLDSAVKTVRAYAKPSASFLNKEVCDGETSRFTDTSSVPEGIISTWTWTFGDGTGSALRSPAHLYLNDGSFTTKLVVSTEFNCIDDTSMTVVINPLPLANFTIARACLKDPIPIENKGTIKSGFVTYLWKYSDGATYETPQPAHIPIITGDVSVWQILTSEKGCMDSILRNTEIWKLPVVTAEKDTNLSFGLPFRLKASGANSYLWTPNEGLDQSAIANPLFNALQSTQFIVYGTDENGCTNSDTIYVGVKEDYQVFPSEVMTPDGNGYNDTWIVKNAENYPNCNVQILDRWGNVVYQENEYRSTWEGTNNNDDILPDGTYYYIITFDGSDRTYKGALTIIRNQ
ncbi:MAG: PKD domain-containing protein [Flavobacteriales bacterium]|nr:PKD domain-containing protein [Flavobacteriales bacterium]